MRTKDRRDGGKAKRAAGSDPRRDCPFPVHTVSSAGASPFVALIGDANDVFRHTHSGIQKRGSFMQARPARRKSETCDLQPLEHRTLLSTVTVNSLVDTNVR